MLHRRSSEYDNQTSVVHFMEFQAAEVIQVN